MGQLLDKLCRQTGALTGNYVIILQGTHDTIDLKHKDREVKDERTLLFRESKLLHEYEKMDQMKKGIADKKAKLFFPYN